MGSHFETVILHVEKYVLSFAFQGFDPFNGKPNFQFHHFMHGFNTQHKDGQNSNANAEASSNQDEFHTKKNFQFKEYFNSAGAKISTFVDPSGGKLKEFL